MKKRLLLVLSLFSLVCTLAFPATVASEIQRQRIQASYLLSFGRKATDDEVAYWTKQGMRTVADLVTNHRNYLTQDAGTHRATIRRSYIDALGREPNDGEYKHWMGGNDTYAQLMKNHVNWLAGNPGEYGNVIKRSYRFVFGRKATDDEVNYWRSQGTLSYAMLVGAHDTWKKQNPSTPPKTSGKATVSTSTGFLTTVVLSPAATAEVRATGLISDDGSTLVAAGGGNLIGNDGGSLIGNDGGSLVAAGGGNLVAAGGGN